jgi:hypothetical protein
VVKRTVTVAVSLCYVHMLTVPMLIRASRLHCYCVFKRCCIELLRVLARNALAYTTVHHAQQSLANTALFRLLHLYRARATSQLLVMY